MRSNRKINGGSTRSVIYLTEDFGIYLVRNASEEAQIILPIQPWREQPKRKNCSSKLYHNMFLVVVLDPPSFRCRAPKTWDGSIFLLFLTFFTFLSLSNHIFSNVFQSRFHNSRFLLGAFSFLLPTALFFPWFSCCLLLFFYNSLLFHPPFGEDWITHCTLCYNLTVHMFALPAMSARRWIKHTLFLLIGWALSYNTY